MFTNIVVGLDGSEASENALRVACDMAQKYKSNIHLVHAPHPQSVAFAMGAMAGYHAVTELPSEKEVKRAAENIFDAGKAVAKKCSQNIKQTHLIHGDPAEAIVDCAKQQKADLIVTGRRGLGSIGSLIQGSTSQKINHLADCHCLTVM